MDTPKDTYTQTVIDLQHTNTSIQTHKEKRCIQKYTDTQVQLKIHKSVQTHRHIFATGFGKLFME